VESGIDAWIEAMMENNVAGKKGTRMKLYVYVWVRKGVVGKSQEEKVLSERGKFNARNQRWKKMYGSGRFSRT
jgi:hypothetical protein